MAIAWFALAAYNGYQAIRPKTDDEIRQEWIRFYTNNAREERIKSEVKAQLQPEPIQVPPAVYEETDDEIRARLKRVREQFDREDKLRVELEKEEQAKAKKDATQD